MMKLITIGLNQIMASGVQIVQHEEGKPGDAFQLMDGSTIMLKSGYHPCAVMPGYEMYYFTILGGRAQRPLQ